MHCGLYRYAIDLYIHKSLADLSLAGGIREQTVAAAAAAPLIRHLTILEVCAIPGKKMTEIQEKQRQKLNAFATLRKKGARFRHTIMCEYVRIFFFFA